jgi:N-acetylneuraminate lyase
MKMLGFDMGPCRLPLVTLSKIHYDKLYSELEAVSFFEKVPSIDIDRKES